MNEIFNKIVEFFATFQPKDWATLLIGLFALAVSWSSLRQRAGERDLALRKQLTDLLEKLTELNTEVDKFRFLRAKKDDYPPNYIGLLNDQRRFVVRQAAFVASKIKNLVSPYEYLIIAGSFDNIDDTYKAEHFYQLAAKTNDQIDSGIAIRSYSRYLFNRGRIEEARQYYSKAIEVFKGETDHLRYVRGETYERWAGQEREWKNETEATSLLESAIAEYESLTNPAWKNYEITRAKGLPPKAEIVEKEVESEDA